MASILYIGTHGTNDPTDATFPFLLAKGAIDAGAEGRELAYILALVMREAAGADDCWTHDVIGDWSEIISGGKGCGCT